MSESIIYCECSRCGDDFKWDGITGSGKICPECKSELEPKPSVFDDMQPDDGPSDFNED
jgi:NAD-dependent SIR2 family protein deacetylase